MFDGLFLQIEGATNLFVAFAFGHEPQDIFLALRQSVQWVIVWRGRAGGVHRGKNLDGKGWRQIGPTGGKIADDCHKFLRTDTFKQISSGARL